MKRDNKTIRFCEERAAALMGGSSDDVKRFYLRYLGGKFMELEGDFGIGRKARLILESRIVYVEDSP